MITLAKVKHGKIYEHYQGNSSEIAYASEDEFSVVEVPNNILKLREKNLKEGKATSVAQWNYSTRKFSIVQIEPNYTLTLKSSLFAIRKMRADILVATDWIEFGNSPAITDQVRQEVGAYRQQLRDMTDNELLSDANNISAYFQEHKDIPSLQSYFPSPIPNYIQQTVLDIITKEFSFNQEIIESLL